jgi:Tfp pilus assembly protein FimT
MMLVIAIFAIMSGIAVSNLREVLISNVENGSARTVGSLLKRARIHAVSTHSRVAVVLSSNTMKLQTCRAVYGGAATCATGDSLTDLTGGSYTFGKGDFKGVNVTGPAEGTALVFGPSGFPETTGTYTFTVDHPERPGNRKVIVTTAGEVRVQ